MELFEVFMGFVGAAAILVVVYAIITGLDKDK